LKKSGNRQMNRLTNLSLTLSALLILACSSWKIEPAGSPHDLIFSSIAHKWDEAVPLGNGFLGELVYEKQGNLRFSIDRSDLWDLRPMENIGCREWKYKWVYEKWMQDECSFSAVLKSEEVNWF